MADKKKAESWEEKTKKILRDDFPNEAYSRDTSRGFELTSIKAAFVIERLNDAFGLCGAGWQYGFSKFHESEEGEIGTKVWIRYRLPNGDWSEKIRSMGGKKIVKNNITDARKGAVTDGITKAASMIGIGHKAFKGLIRKKPNTSTPYK